MPVVLLLPLFESEVEPFDVRMESSLCLPRLLPFFWKAFLFREGQ